MRNSVINPAVAAALQHYPEAVVTTAALPALLLQLFQLLQQWAAAAAKMVQICNPLLSIHRPD